MLVVNLVLLSTVDMQSHSTTAVRVKQHRLLLTLRVMRNVQHAMSMGSRLRHDACSYIDATTGNTAIARSLGA